jgi:hypothetical protein
MFEVGHACAIGGKRIAVVGAVTKKRLVTDRGH